MAPMPEPIQKVCPSCGARRIGSFRWCRECGFDFDSVREAGPAPRPPFALTPPGQFTQAPQVIPAVTPAADAVPPPPPPVQARPATPLAQPSPDAIGAQAEARRRPSLPLVAGVLLIVLFGAAGFALIVLQRPTTDTAGGPGAPSGASTRIVAPTPFEPIALSGDGPATAQFSIPEGSSGIATIVNQGEGPFSVWSIGADGAKQDLLVNVVGAYSGIRLFHAIEHSVLFAVESDGTWSIEVQPIAAARTWDVTEPLTGDGSDVVVVLPPTSAETGTVVIYEGDSTFALDAVTRGGDEHLVDELGAFRGDVVLPSGTSLLDIDADAAWSITPD
jgi:hypothetical protein